MSTRTIINCRTGQVTFRVMTAEEETAYAAKVAARAAQGDAIATKLSGRAAKLTDLKNTGKTVAERLVAAADLLDGRF